MLLRNRGKSGSLGKELKLLKRHYCNALQRHLQLDVKNGKCGML